MLVTRPSVLSPPVLSPSVLDPPVTILPEPERPFHGAGPPSIGRRAAITVVLAAGLQASGAAAVDLSIETFDADDHPFEIGDYASTGLRTVRLFVDDLPAGWSVLAARGTPEGPLVIDTDGETAFFNAPDFGQGHGPATPALFSAFPSLQWDTWLVIGDEPPAVSPAFPDVALAAGGSPVLGDELAAWFDPTPATPAFEIDGRVLIGQFSAPACTPMRFVVGVDLLDDVGGLVQLEGLVRLAPDDCDGGPVVLRCLTPAAWQAAEVRWAGDAAPWNKVDDQIDEGGAGPYDLIVNYRRAVSDGDLDFIESLDGAEVAMRSRYLSSVFVTGATREDVMALADRNAVAFIELQPTFEFTLDVSVASICAAPGSTSCDCDAWTEFGVDGSGVNIAIMDSGVDNDVHDTFDGVPVVGGYNAATGVFGDPDDDCSHGTHVASIALGRGSASVDPGVAPGAGLIDVKVSNGCSIPAGAICDGLETIYDQRDAWDVGVINMSLSSCNAFCVCTHTDGTDFFSQLVDLSSAMGIVVVAAAGNCGPVNDHFGTPASAARSITVASSFDMDSTGRGDDVLSSFSNRGPREDDGDFDEYDELKPEVTAPGEDILAAEFDTTDGDLELSGTSMAAPHVAGLAALLLEHRPGMNAASVKQAIINASEPRGTPTLPATDPVWNFGWGWGLVDACATLEAATADTDLTFPNHPAEPEYKSVDLSTAPFPPVVGEEVTVTADIRNAGPAPAFGVRVKFGVNVWSAGTPEFHDIGTRIVDLPVGDSAVSITWVPDAAEHQCLKVELGYGPDSDHTNNIAKRNLHTVDASFEAKVWNALSAEPSLITFDVDGPWDVDLQPPDLVLAGEDCPANVQVTPIPPDGTPHGTTRTMDVTAMIGETVLGGFAVRATMIDVDGDGVHDPRAIADGRAEDCNRNGVPDDFEQVACLWCEDFDAYDEGPLAGLGGWEPWNGDPSVGDFRVLERHRDSVPLALAVDGDDDAVRRIEGAEGGGRWVLTSKVFVPRALEGVQYLVLLNTYPQTEDNDFSLGLVLDGGRGEVGEFADPTASLPLVRSR